jgi:hypothetical protein
MPRLELTFLYLGKGVGCNVRAGEQTRARGPSRLPAVGRYGHSESSADLLMHPGSDFARFSEHALISLKVLPDFDSTMRRFESSRPGSKCTAAPAARSHLPPTYAIVLSVDVGRIDETNPGFTLPGHSPSLYAWWESAFIADQRMGSRESTSFHIRLADGGLPWRTS